MWLYGDAEKKIKKSIIIFTGLFLLGIEVKAKDYFYNCLSVSIEGYSGYIYTPASQVVGLKRYNLGIHNFNLAVNYGIFPSTEIGVMCDIKGISGFKIQKVRKNNSRKLFFHGKYQVFKEQDYFCNLSVGLKHDILYLVISKYFPQFHRLGINFGLNLGPKDNKVKLTYFFAFSKFYIDNPTMVIFDYDGHLEKYNLGCRILLFPTLKVDIFLIDLGNWENFFDTVVFGFSFSG